MPPTGHASSSPLTAVSLGFEHMPVIIEALLLESGFRIGDVRIEGLDNVDLLITDIRNGVSDNLLLQISDCDAVKLAFGELGTNDPVSDAAFDDALPPYAAESDLRRRFTLAARYASARRAARTGEADEALRLANGSLQFALRRFESLFQGLPAACFTLDAEGTIHEWNAEATRLFRMESYQATYRSAAELFGPDWTIEALHARAREGGQFDWNWLSPAGSRIWMECRLLPIYAPDGTITAIVATNIDVTGRVVAQRQVQAYAQRVERQATKLARANAELEERSLTDPLTGLGNRRRFDESLALALERQRRTGTPFSLLVLDLDRFKSINDEFGHNGGDEVLRATAQALRKAARKLEPPLRLGGEEFALILEGCDPAKALRVALRVQRHMAQHPWPCRPVTASLGLASSRPDDTVESIFARADAELYRAKEDGRDCLRIAA